MTRSLKKPKTGNNPEIILCRKSKQFENIIVCTFKCFERCEAYFNQFDIEIIQKYIDTHPNYEMKGVIMPATKKMNHPLGEKKKDPKKEKLYWIITDENQYLEVSQQEIMDNPAEYIGKQLFEKPKDEFEILVMIKKKGKK